MGHQRIAINDMCEEDKIEGLHKDAPVLKSFTVKKSGKNSIDVLFWLQNWEINKRFSLIKGAQTLLSEKLVMG